MDSTEEKKLFEDEKFVIISSTREIDMTQWRNHLIKNWNKVGFLFLSSPFDTHNLQVQLEDGSLREADLLQNE